MSAEKLPITWWNILNYIVQRGYGRGLESRIDVSGDNNQEGACSVQIEEQSPLAKVFVRAFSKLPTEVGK